MAGTWLKSVTKKNWMKYFCIIKEKIAYMECVIQSSMFNSFYLFLSILGCNVDSSLVSNSNAYNLNLESCSNVRIYIRMLRECVFSTCSWKMVFSDDVGKEISQLHEELVNAYKKKLLLRGRGCCLCWTWRNARGFSWTNVTKRNSGG